MLAFLKRRWILLSCAAVLAACTIIDGGHVSHGSYAPESIESIFPVWSGCVIYNGNLAIFRGEESILFAAILSSSLIRPEDNLPFSVVKTRSEWRWHAPDAGSRWMFMKSGPSLILPGGGRPSFTRNIISIYLEVPIWLPLSAVLGCLVIRELRWRKTRVKACSVSQTRFLPT